MILKIASMVLDDYLDTRSYDVQSQPEYGNGWVDGWWYKHKERIRDVISGKAVLTFLDKTTYRNFINSLSTFEDPQYGTLSVKLYVNNLGEVRTINAFVTHTSKVVFATKAYLQRDLVYEVTLKIEER